MQTTFERWGWIGTEGPQVEFYESADDAISEMRRRLSWDISIERLREIGFELALVRVTISPVAILKQIAGD